MQDETLTEKIIGCAFKVHSTLGPGYLEKVYENAMCIELAKQSLQVKQQQPVIVHYEGQVVGEYLCRNQTQTPHLQTKDQATLADPIAQRQKNPENPVNPV